MINKIQCLRKAFQLSGIRWCFGRIKFPLPDLGQKIKEGTVKRLYVNEGDDIEEFQKIADVESDKQFTQITAPETGKIAKLFYKETEVCKVGDLFLEIETPKKEEPSQGAKHQKKIVEAAKSQKKNQKPFSVYDDGILASPVVRMFAKQRNVDIERVRGSGRKGRILKEDVLALLEGKQNQEISSQEVRVIKMNNFQKGMQKSMTQSNKIPHLYLHEEINVSEADHMRHKLKSMNVRVTMMGILMKTFSLALRLHPKMNSTYLPDEQQFNYQIHSRHNISVAIDSPNGLVVPNVKDVSSLSILQIQKHLEQLRTLASNGQLTGHHLREGTICLSNIGTIGGISACPLLLPPQICIVAIGKLTEIPHFVHGSIQRKKQISVTFGCDHRVVDGATVTRFAAQWKKQLENPWLGFVNMC